MTIQTTYTQARTRLADFCDTAVNDREIVMIHRRGAEDVEHGMVLLESCRFTPSSIALDGGRFMQRGAFASLLPCLPRRSGRWAG